MINYDNYRIEIQNFHQYYVAIIMGGSLSVEENEYLSNEINDFAATALGDIDFEIIDTKVTHEISGRLKNKFHDFTFEKRTKQQIF